MIKYTTIFAAIAGLVLALAPAEGAETLTATTDIEGGVAIPTDPGTVDYLPSGYTYYIDDNPGDTAQNTLVDFNMGAYDLTRSVTWGTRGDDYKIYASSLSHGAGGSFSFRSSDSGGRLTIIVDDTLEARAVDTTGTGSQSEGQRVILTAPNGITLIDGIDSSAGTNGSGAVGDITLTSTGSTGFIQIGGELDASAGQRTSTVILTAENDINLLAGGIDTHVTGSQSSTANGGSITLTSTAGSVEIAGSLNANSFAGTDGNLSITASSGQITLGSLDLSLVNQVTLLASPTTVEIDALLNASGFIGGGDFTGFWDVSSNVIYNPVNSPGLSGYYNIVEGNGFSGGFLLMPEPATMALLAFGGLGILIRRRRRS